jgi:mono/diheme cytochrome c family protein
VTASGSIPAGWQEYTSADSGFSCIMPSKPNEMSQMLPTPTGQITVKLYVAPLADGSCACLVSCNDLPGGQELDPERFVDEALKNISKTMPGGKLLGEKKMTWLGHPARELQLEAPGGSGTVRLLVVDRRMYQVGFLGAKPLAQAEAFFNSFRLTSKSRSAAPQSASPAGGQHANASEFRAVLTRHCAKCHTGENAKGDFALFSAPGTLDSGVDKGKVWQMVSSNKMPPKRQPRLGTDEVEALRNWTSDKN